MNESCHSVAAQSCQSLWPRPFASPGVLGKELVGLIQLSSGLEQAPALAASLAFFLLLLLFLCVCVCVESYLLGKSCHLYLYQVDTGWKSLSCMQTEATLHTGFQGIENKTIILEVYCLC